MKVIAIEGGGSRTRAWLVDGDRDAPQVLAEKRAGPANFRTLGPQRFGQLVKTFADALVEGHGGLAEVKAIGLGIAGIANEDERASARSAVFHAGLGQPVQVTSDARATLEGALRGEPGVLLIAGTGSIAMGVNADGHEARAGGWGHQLGDEGSGYALGRLALVRATLALDGRRPDPEYVADLAAFLEVGAARLAGWIRAHATDVDAVAGLAPFFVRREDARASVDRTALELADLVRAVRDALALPALAPVVLYGGLLLGDPYYRERVAEAVGGHVLMGNPDDGIRGCVRLAHRAPGAI